MNALFIQLLAVASSVLLVLPPGWCSSLTSDRADVVPVKAMCCHQSHRERSSDSPSAPAQPTFDCCCSWDATLPEKPLPPDDFSPALLTAVELAPVRLVQPPWLVVTETPLDIGPPLHVLQCVWLC